MVSKAQAAEAAGFDGVALMDHLAPPLAEDQPMWDAMVTATWLAARTERITISHLVLCDAFRHPAMLAREVVALDHASSGRFELGIGWGSVPAELATFGVGSTEPRDRVERLARDARGGAGPVDRRARRLRRASSTSCAAASSARRPSATSRSSSAGPAPRPSPSCESTRTGGTCPSTRPTASTSSAREVGDVKASIQQMVTYAPDPATRDEVIALADRRFAHMPGRVAGDSDEMVAFLRGLEARGLERVYLWFSDFADEATLATFGAEVLPHL